jgi:uncharacterized damage-inducible protein DinB
MHPSTLETMRLAWASNRRINDALLHHLTPEMLHVQTPGGGYTVAQHLAHMVGTLKYWTSNLDQNAVKPIEDLFDPNTEAFIPETDLARIRRIWHETLSVALEVATHATTTGDLPHATTAQFLTHMLVHDAHHRGQILLAFKTNGFALPNEDAIWGPWREDRLNAQDRLEL